MPNWAELSFNEKGEPFSDTFGDVYYSKAGGAEESRYVFLNGNSLEQRFQNLQENGCFSILETGFGTGLNFLTTLELWKNTAPKGANLHFHSIEKYPLRPEEFTKVQNARTNFTPTNTLLSEGYEIALKGGILQINNAALTLHMGDIAEILPKLAQEKLKVDALFLDGFSPAKNPEMWGKEVLAPLREISRKGTTLATFTCARIARESLELAGFSLQKQKGFSGKREMLTGVFSPLSL